jgi:UDP-N-acetylmuramate dehydrogenase
VSGTITRVRVIDRDAFRACDLPASSCGFGYRTSRFKHADAERFVVTRVEFELTRNGPPTIAYADVIAQFERTGNPVPTLADVRDAVLAIRRRKGMVIDRGPEAIRSVGSFFVNPVVSREQFDRLQRQADLADVRIPHYVLDAQTIKIPAAWLIERAGFARGFARGPVGISPFQAQAIVNRGGALAIDVVRLATDIKREVWRQFGIGIVPEPVFVGFAASPELDWLRTAIPADTAQA